MHRQLKLNLKQAESGSKIVVQVTANAVKIISVTEQLTIESS